MSELDMSQICPRCIQRMKLNIRIHSVWVDSAAEFSTDDEKCGGCLGILSPSFVQSTADAIMLHLEQVGYDNRHIRIGMNLPTNILIREMALWLVMKNIPSTNDQNELWSVKECMKHLLREELVSKGVEIDSGKPLEIFVSLELTNFSSQSDFEKFNELNAGNESAKNVSWDRSHKRKSGKTNSKSSIALKLSNISSEDLSRYNFLSSACDPTEVSVSSKRDSCFIMGRYNKYSRELSQTPWDLSDNSVQDEICKDMRSAFTFGQDREFKFSSAGREDQDVRMLGNGRDFVLEVIDPIRIPEKLPEFTSTIAKVSDAVLSYSSDVMELLKEGEEEKRKSYRALIWFSHAHSEESFNKLLSVDFPLQTNQKTPIRVSHRRTLMVRPRLIHSLKTRYVNSHFAFVDLETQAGTYIKEFVHGDRGRTVPSISSLLDCECDILQLDVLDIVKSNDP